jgi:TM2 domain-containing membrane protein YozV
VKPVHAVAVGAMIVVSFASDAQTPADAARGRIASGQPVALAACPAVKRPAAPTDAQRRAARALVQRGQQAAILGDRAAAREQFRQAAQLDPTDADLAYELARAHDGAGASADAAAEYCRFLALAPSAPEAAEVRERVATLSVPPRAAAPAPRPLSPTNALALGLVIPGGGQFYAGRPMRGMLALGTAAIAFGWGMSAQPGSVSVQETALDPFGNPYNYTVTRATTSRPHLVPGLAAAGAIAIASAVDAYHFSRRMSDGRDVALRLMPHGDILAIGIAVR